MAEVQSMADRFLEIDSEGVYVGMSLRDFGVRVSQSNEHERLEMPRDQLRESIAHLQEELSGGEPLSPDDRARLESVLGEVSGILESDDSGEPNSTGIFDELPSLVGRFETTHPKLAVVLGRIADSLSQLGI
jgi:hypothetical protein